MSYEDTISDVVKVVEAVGAGIMVLGGLGSFLVFARQALRAETADGSYERLRRNLGRSILLGLEVLIVADIVRTIIVDPNARERRGPRCHRHHPDSAELLARGRDGRGLAVAPVAARAPRRRPAPGHVGFPACPASC